MELAKVEERRDLAANPKTTNPSVAAAQGCKCKAMGAVWPGAKRAARWALPRWAGGEGQRRWAGCDLRGGRAARTPPGRLDVMSPLSCRAGSALDQPWICLDSRLSECAFGD